MTIESSPWRWTSAGCCSGASTLPTSVAKVSYVATLPVCTSAPCVTEHSEDLHDSTPSFFEERGTPRDEWEEVTLPMPRQAHCRLLASDQARQTRPDAHDKQKFTWSEAKAPQEIHLDKLLDYVSSRSSMDTIDMQWSLRSESEVRPAIPPASTWRNEVAPWCDEKASKRTVGIDLPIVPPHRTWPKNLSLPKGLGATRVFRRSSHNVGQGNSAAMSESMMNGNIQVRLSDADADRPEIGQNSSCGFTVVMPCAPAFPSRPAVGQKEPSRNLGMCHHYTWDGKHCVSAGLSGEHANKCAGCLHSAGALPNGKLCRVVGAHALTTCSKIDVDHFEAACGPPAADKQGQQISSCTVDACPFLARGQPCPYMSGIASSVALSVGKLDDIPILDLPAVCIFQL